jgi:hypothetical protein
VKGAVCTQTYLFLRVDWQPEVVRKPSHWRGDSVKVQPHVDLPSVAAQDALHGLEVAHRSTNVLVQRFAQQGHALERLVGSEVQRATTRGLANDKAIRASGCERHVLSRRPQHKRGAELLDDSYSHG